MDQDPTQPFEPVAPVNPPEAPGPAAAPPAPPAPPAAPLGATAPHGAQAAYETPRPYEPARSYGQPMDPPPAMARVSPTPAGIDVPVAAVGGRRGRRNPVRYVVALLVVALVVAGGLGATLLLTGSSGGPSGLAGYAPTDTQMYAEARFDLPGGQHAEVAKALAAFPGFADQAALNTKLGELYDRILRAATKDKHDYQTQIAPWFGGQLAIASRGVAAGGGSATPDPTASLPACTGGGTATPAPSASTSIGMGLPSMAAAGRALLLASVTDPAKAGAWVTSILDETSAQTDDRTCDGVTVHVARVTSRIPLPEYGWAVLGDKVLVAGDLDSVRLAIATKGTTGLSADATFQKASAALTGDHVGFFYEAARAIMQQAAGAGGDTPDAKALTAFSGLLQGFVPEWIVGDLKAANGNVVIDTAQPKNSLQAATNRASDLAALAPAKTVALLDAHDLGKTLAALHDTASADPQLQSYVKQLDSALSLAGGVSGTVGWIGDAGLAITRDGAKVSGGLLVRPDDAAAATRLFGQVRGLIDLAGPNSGLKATDQDYKGVKLTSIDLSAMVPALESSMGNSGVTVPPDLQLVYAVTDKVVVLTLDPSFAKAVVDASQGGDSLAKDGRFSALVGQAGASNAGMAWMDVTAVRELAEGSLPSAQRAKYEADVRPYLLPLDAVVSTSVVDGDLIRGTMVVSLNH